MIISAYNVHHGGGKILLEGILETLAQNPQHQTLVFLDARLTSFIPKSKTCEVIFVKPTLWGRLKAEYEIRKRRKNFDLLFCFGNLPPLFRNPGPTVIYLQNKYLISRQFICWTNLKTALRTFIEKIWFELKKSSHYVYIVQTPSMKNAFIENQGASLRCEVLGFTPKLENAPPRSEKGKFLYVASGEPHKNHKNLLKAWKELKDLGLTYPLTLILNSTTYPELTKWIEDYKNKYNLNVFQKAPALRQELMEIYKSHDALIFPSYLESFGLPLLEAKQLGLAILAAELDYVRDSVEPAETFDPSSPVSMSRAVRRYMNVSERTLISSTPDFLKTLVDL